MLFLLFIVCTNAIIIFDIDTFQATLHRELRRVYAGQFDCLHPNATGVRSLLKFDLHLINPTNHNIRLGSAPKIAFIISDASTHTVLKSGSIFDVCVRDSTCQTNVESTVCRFHTLSAHCNSTTPLHSECSLIDATGIHAPKIFLYLQLQSDSYLVDPTWYNITVQIANLPLWKKTSKGVVFPMAFIGSAVALFSVVPVVIDRKWRGW